MKELLKDLKDNGFLGCTAGADGDNIGTNDLQSTIDLDMIYFMEGNDRLLIFSVFQDKLDEAENLENHSDAKEWLKENDIDYIQLEGIQAGKRYKFLIVLEGYRHALEWLCWGHSQPSYIEVYSDKFASRVDRDGKHEALGYFRSIKEEEAVTSDNWYYRPDLKAYYRIKE